MIDKKRIETEAEHFFEWPTDDRNFVTRTSMLIFANVIAEMARTEEREACAKVCDPYTSGQWYAAAIRKRSNAIGQRGAAGGASDSTRKLGNNFNQGEKK